MYVQQHFRQDYFSPGIFIGGFLAGNILSHPLTIVISHEATIQLQSIGIQDISGFALEQLFTFAALKTVSRILIIVFGEFLIGFGSRNAGGWEFIRDNSYTVDLEAGANRCIIS